MVVAWLVLLMLLSSSYVVTTAINVDKYARAVAGDRLSTGANCRQTPTQTHKQLTTTTTKNPGLFTGRVKSRGSGRVGSRRLENLAGRIGSGQDVSKISRVGSGRVKTSRKSRGSGRVGSRRLQNLAGRVGSAGDLTRT